MLITILLRDLLLFNGTGALHAMTKLATNSSYCTRALCFACRNKWTKRDDLYVLEIAKNNEGTSSPYILLLDVGMHDSTMANSTFVQASWMRSWRGHTQG